MSVGEFDDNVSTPRLANHEWLGPVRITRCKKLDNVGNVIGNFMDGKAVVRLIAVSVAAKVERDDAMAQFGECTSGPVPEPSI